MLQPLERASEGGRAIGVEIKEPPNVQPSVSPLYVQVQLFMPHLPLVPQPGFHEAVSSLVIPGWWGMTVLPYPHLSLGRQGAGGRRAVTGPWTESVAWGHGTT